MLLGNMVGFDIFLKPLGRLLRRSRRQGVRMKFKLYRAEYLLAGCIDKPVGKFKKELRTVDTMERLDQQHLTH